MSDATPRFGVGEFTLGGYRWGRRRTGTDC
jgi:hypothetical protein